MRRKKFSVAGEFWRVERRVEPFLESFWRVEPKFWRVLESWRRVELILKKFKHAFSNIHIGLESPAFNRCIAYVPVSYRSAET